MSKGTSDKKDYVLDLPEMSVEKISKLCWTVQRGINQDAQAQLEEIVRRCNQFIPQVMKYKRLLDQFDREVIQPEIAAKKELANCRVAEGASSRINGKGREYCVVAKYTPNAQLELEDSDYHQITGALDFELAKTWFDRRKRLLPETEPKILTRTVTDWEEYK